MASTFCVFLFTIDSKRDVITSRKSTHELYSYIHVKKLNINSLVDY